MSLFRTDAHNNPTAFTTTIASQAKLVEGTDYEIGSPFTADGRTYYTARLLGDPVETTIDVINRLGFYTAFGAQRWDYIGIPKWLWDKLPPEDKRQVIKYMYSREGGTEMLPLFNA